jgi:hypothetical protein
MNENTLELKLTVIIISNPKFGSTEPQRTNNCHCPNSFGAHCVFREKGAFGTSLNLHFPLASVG